MTKIHQKLATILSKLNKLKNAPMDTLGTHARSFDLRDLQAELHALEEEHPIIGAKMLGPDGSIPKGQAIISTLLHKCYKLVHELVEMEPEIDESLLKIYSRLKEIHANLASLLVDLQSGFIEPDVLSVWQREIDRIDSLRKDGNFIVNGEIPTGYAVFLNTSSQAILIDELEKCYDLIHECLLTETSIVTEEHLDNISTLKILRDDISDAVRSGAHEISEALQAFIGMASKQTPRFKALCSR